MKLSEYAALASECGVHLHPWHPCWLARPCTPHGGWQNPQRPPSQRACYRKMTSKAAKALLHRHTDINASEASAKNRSSRRLEDQEDLNKKKILMHSNVWNLSNNSCFNGTWGPTEAKKMALQNPLWIRSNVTATIATRPDFNKVCLLRFSLAAVRLCASVLLQSTVQAFTANVPAATF